MILGLTALVWLAMAMSERKEYNLPVKVKMTGFDTKRYAVVSADTLMMLQVESTGFNVFFLGLKKEPLTIEFDIKNEAVHRHSQRRDTVVDLFRTVAVADLSTLLSDQLSAFGVHYKSSGRDSLQLVLNERASKVFRPDLSNMKINFSEGFGLYGEPMVSPMEVTLYGSPEVLAAIGGVGVKPMTLTDVRETRTYRIPLDKAWKALGDVYASDDILTVNIPVNSYVEQHFIVPVTVDGVDTNQGLRLYPDRVTFHVWVAQDDFAAVSAERFSASVDYRDISSGAQRLKLNVDRFPRNVRIRKIEPEEIEYVIIK